MRSGSGVKPWFVLLALCVALAIKGCSFANITSTNNPQPLVAALPAPKLPDWIEQISPIGDAATTAQIRIRFKEPIIPLENLENESQELLKKFEVVPPLPGTFRFLTPRMVGFQGDQAIPKATRVQVTLKAGLADLKNHRLDQDLAWTFNTEAIKLSNLPGMSVPGDAAEAARPLDLKPVLKFTSNVELNLASLKERVKLIPANEPKANKGVTLNAALEKSEEQSKESYPETPDAQFDPSARDWIYTLEPQQALAKATRYRLAITPGLAAAKGNLASESAFASQVETYAPLAFQKLNYYGQP
jgi:hypothetical protein